MGHRVPDQNTAVIALARRRLTSSIVIGPEELVSGLSMKLAGFHVSLHSPNQLHRQQKTNSSSIEPGNETVTLVVLRTIVFGIVGARRLGGACIENKAAFKVADLDEKFILKQKHSQYLARDLILSL